MEDVTQFDLDMDGSMEPSEGGQWVRAEDYFKLEQELETLRQRLAAVEAALPDDYSPSKDWAFDRGPVQRIEWLKSFHKQYKQEVEELYDRLAEEKQKV